MNEQSQTDRDKYSYAESVARNTRVGLCTLTVRARVRQDLDDLRAKYLPDLSPTEFDPQADYHYRAVAARESVALAIANLVRESRYENFKDEVSRVQGDERAAVYHSVWAALARLQRPARRAVDPTIPTIYASIGRRQDVLGDADDDPTRR